MIQAQQRMAEELNARNRQRKASAAALKETEQQLKATKRALLNVQGIVDERNAALQVTPGWLGEGQKNLGGNICRDRRHAILDRYAKLGEPMLPEERNRLAVFKGEWDSACQKKHGEDWPEKFLQMMKAVLDKLEHNPRAFRKFMYDQERKVLGGTRALLIPPPGHLAITG